MSILDSFSGFFGASYGGIAVSDGRAAPAPDAKVTPQDPTERYYGNYLSGAGSFPGFDQIPPWTIPLAWQIRQDDTAVLAHTIITVPILAGVQSIEINKGKEGKLADRMKAAAEEDLLPSVEEWLPGMLEDIFFGAFLQEIVWDRRNGRMVPVAFPSILPGEATIYRDRYRNFVGFEVNGDYRDARYALLSVCEPHIDPLHGYARTQSVRRPWWRKIKSEENADKTERKASGIQMGVGMPMGASFVDDAGKPTFPKDVAQALINAAVQGQTFTFPLTPFTKADIIKDPKLADIPAVKIQAFDWGNIGPSLAAHLARKDGLNIAIMRGMKRPEREAMQGTHGTNAESDTQGQIGTLDSEYVARMKMRQATRQVVDRWAVTNFGPEAIGVLRIQQAPLSDPQQAFLQKAALAIAADASTGPTLLSNVDQRKLLEKVEIPMVSPEDAAKVVADQEAKAAAADAQAAAKAIAGANGPGAGNDAANANAKPVNGNGRVKLDADATAVLGRLAGYMGMNGSDE